MNMKKLIILSLAVVAMAGCQKDDNLGSSQSGNVVSFSSESLSTRLNSISQEWEANDKVGIFMYNHDKTAYTYNNIEYAATPNSDASTAKFTAVASGSAIEYPNGVDVAFNAYYPHDSQMVVGSTLDESYTTIDISDQSDLGAIDLMVAGEKTVEWSSTSTSTPVAFSFEHKLTKLVFNVETQYSVEDISDLRASLSSVIGKEVKYNLLGQQVATLSSTDLETPIELYVEYDAADKTKATITAILHPSSSEVDLYFSLGYDFASADPDANCNYIVDLFLSQSSLVAGYQYQYSVILGEEDAKFTGDTQITPWEDGVPTDSSLDAATKSYAISSEEDLKKIGNQFPLDGNYELMDDIELSLDDVWTPIGGIDMVMQTFVGFNGTFNGNNHTISGLCISGNIIGDYGMTKGLFGVVSTSGVVKNLNVEGKIEFTGDVDAEDLDGAMATTGAIGYVGGVVGFNQGEVDNCTSKMDIYLNNCSDVYGVAGVVGCNQAGKVTNCTSYNASLELKNNKLIEDIAGVVGTNSGGTVENCHNYFEFDLTKANWEQRDNDPANNSLSPTRLITVGGVVGQSDEGNIIDCSNRATFALSDIYCSYVGGVVAKVVGGYDVITGCYNSGSIMGSYIENCGGVVGILNSDYSSVSNCYNISSYIIGYKSVGGVIGKIYCNASIINCYNQSDIEGNQYLGGVVGEWNCNGGICSIVNCGTVGSINAVSIQVFGSTVESAFVGGLIGELIYANIIDNMLITACYSASTLSGASDKSDSFIGAVWNSNAGQSYQYNLNTLVEITDCYVSVDSSIDDSYFGTIETVDIMTTNDFVGKLNSAAAFYNSSLSAGDTNACSWKLGDSSPILDFGNYPSN